MTSGAKPRKPLPRPDRLTEPYWQAAREGYLAIQRCGACGYYNHPPKPQCDRCLSERLKYERVSGKGRIWSYTVTHRTIVSGFDDEVPYAILLVELDEQPNLLVMTNLVGAPASAARIGAPVEVAFQDSGDPAIRLPQFRLAPDFQAR